MGGHSDRAKEPAVPAFDSVDLFLGGVVRVVPLALERQQAVLEGDLQIVDPDARGARQETASERHSLPSYSVHCIVNGVHSQTLPEANVAQQRQAAADDAGSRPLWFIPPAGADNHRRTLTREHVVAEALTVI